MSADTRACSRWLYTLGRRAAGRIGLTVAVGWLIGLAAVLQAFLLSRLIHAIFIDARPVETLARDFGLLAAAVAGRALLMGMREVSGFAAGARVRESVRLELVDRIFAAGPAFTRREESGAIGSVLLEQVEALQDFYALYLPQLALALLVPLTIAAAVFPVSWAAGSLLLLTAPLIPFFTVLVGMGAESISQKHFQALGRMSAHFLDVLQGLTTLKLFGRSRAEGAEIARVSAEYRRRTMSVLRVAFLSSAVLEFFASLSIALVAVYLGMGFLGYFQFGTYGRPLTLADGLFVLLLAPEFYLPLRELGAHYHARAQAIGAAVRIRDVAEAPLAAGLAGRGPLPPGGELHVRCADLWFGYDDGRPPAVQGISLELRPGRSVALVGGSGAGKSWLADRLRREFGDEATSLSLDDFYRDLSHLMPSEREKINFDHPGAIDWPRFEGVLRELQHRVTAWAPRYSFVSHTRLTEREPHTPRPFIFVEGLWLLRPPHV